MQKPTAMVVLASASPHAKPIITFKLRYWWAIHGEVMTHRVFSRNASSNRAIPLRKMIEEAVDDKLRAGPVLWAAEQKGMQVGDELGPREREATHAYWRDAATMAATQAQRLAEIGVHKSICNRLLMPFTSANVVLTSTEWDNFFGLRLDAAAEPTMRYLAERMWVAYNECEPRALTPGQWHTPFIGDMRGEDGDAIHGFMLSNDTVDIEQELAIKVSVARCARVSYESHETQRRSTVEEDLRLYDRLASSGHWSPFEHQATPDEPGGVIAPDQPVTWSHAAEHGNLAGWLQYRKMMPNESAAALPEPYHTQRAQTDRSWMKGR